MIGQDSTSTEKWEGGISASDSKLTAPTGSPAAFLSILYMPELVIEPLVLGLDDPVIVATFTAVLAELRFFGTEIPFVGTKCAGTGTRFPRRAAVTTTCCEGERGPAVAARSSSNALGLETAAAAEEDSFDAGESIDAF